MVHTYDSMYVQVKSKHKHTQGDDNMELYTNIRAALREWARAHLAPDHFGSGPHGDGYTTTSLYFETPGFDVYHRRGSYGRSKFRIRRYGEADIVFLERK